MDIDNQVILVIILAVIIGIIIFWGFTSLQKKVCYGKIVDFTYDSGGFFKPNSCTITLENGIKISRTANNSCSNLSTGTFFCEYIIKLG